MISRLHVPLTRPEDVIPHLAKQAQHWKPEYSAQELAVAWSTSINDFPSAVRSALETDLDYAGADLVDGFFEREVHLGSPGRNSQTDLMVVAGLKDSLGIIAVEGKVEEPFGDYVSDWNSSPGKQRRLEGLCATLGLYSTNVGALRYQLLHRTASAIYEAKRYRCRHALMLVHSFSPTHRWFQDFVDISCALRIPMSETGRCSPTTVCEGISLRLAWVADLQQSRFISADSVIVEGA